MNITQQAPPKEPTRSRITQRRSYRELFETLRRSNGVWLTIDPGEVSGETNSRKQTVLYISAQIRKMKIQTTIQEGMLYVRTYCDEVTHA
jgi:hypothetical protein